MSTMNDEQESNTPELTNLIDVVAAESGKPEVAKEPELELEPEVIVEITETVEVITVETAVEDDVVVTTVTDTVVEETAVVVETAVKDDVVVATVTDTVVTETAVVETAVIEEKPVKPPKRQKPPRKQRQKRNSAVTKRDVKSWFSTCGRCGFFLTGYDLLETDIDLETAVVNTKGEWLTLDWNYEIRNLVNKSYGHHVDTGYLDTGCPECRRRFIIDADGDERSFRIALNPAIKR